MDMGDYVKSSRDCILGREGHRTRSEETRAMSTVYVAMTVRLARA